MTNAANIAKISVEKHDSKEQFLYELDKSKSLCEVIRDICKNGGLPQSTVYGLKLIRTNDPTINSYICEKNYKNVQHSDCLKIVFSVKYLLKNRILPYINREPGDPERAICYDDLAKLVADPVFIDELVSSENHYQLIDTFIKDDSLDDTEIGTLLLTICHLLRKNSITNTSQDFLEKTICIIKKKREIDEIPPDYVQYALSVLQKILVQKDIIFRGWKEKIVKEVSINSLISYIRFKNLKNLQYTVILLINTIIKLCKKDQKKQLIKEMSLNKNRENIYKFIIEPGDLDKNMEHELYVIQTYLMSLYEEALKNDLNLNDESAFQKEEFELPEDDIRRLTVLMDFDEMDLPNRSNSLETLLTHNVNERFSLVSLMSDKSNHSRLSSVRSSRASCDWDYDNLTINCLTLNALRHFKINHKKNFLQSQIEEKVYEPGIFITSERVVKMLADMLHIGVDPPDAKSVFYQPIVFNTSPRQPFLLELFARSMWLLSKTRREMKVSTIEDYSKVMKVLQKQIQMVLDKKPKDIKHLTNDIKETTFQAVLQQWQKENDEKMRDLLENNKNIDTLKTKYATENDRYVRENRLNALKRGEYFPKISDKFHKTNRQIFVQLSKNERELYLSDVIDKKIGRHDRTENLIIADITHIAVGKNCKHKHLSKFPALVFSIIFNHVNQVNFIAKDEKMASHWIDGFNILAGYSKRSDNYTKELNVLVEMDVRLQIIELQNISLPNTPPPIPPMPKPLVPPRPPMISNRRKIQKI